MRDQEPEAADQDWARIAAAFLRAPSKPSPIETEAFVCRVMARLEADSPWAAAFRWLVPSTSFALALSLAFMLQPTLDFVEPADAFLMMKGESSGLARLTNREQPSPADLFALSLEER